MRLVHQNARTGRQSALRGPETRIGRSLPARARHLRESPRSAIPSRSLQPIPLEHVLERSARLPCWGSSSLSSITEHSFHGITPSLKKKGESVTYVSGTICHLCLESLINHLPAICVPWSAAPQSILRRRKRSCLSRLEFVGASARSWVLSRRKSRNAR